MGLKSAKTTTSTIPGQRRGIDGDRHLHRVLGRRWRNHLDARIEDHRRPGQEGFLHFRPARRGERIAALAQRGSLGRRHQGRQRNCRNGQGYFILSRSLPFSLPCGNSIRARISVCNESRRAKVCWPEWFANPRAKHWQFRQNLLASLPGPGRDKPGRTEQTDCATLEQVVTFEAAIRPANCCNRGKKSVFPCRPRPTGQRRIQPGMAQPLQNRFPASGPIQGMEGGSPACHSGLMRRAQRGQQARNHWIIKETIHAQSYPFQAECPHPCAD